MSEPTTSEVLAAITYLDRTDDYREFIEPELEWETIKAKLDALAQYKPADERLFVPIECLEASERELHWMRQEATWVTACLPIAFLAGGLVVWFMGGM